MTARNDPALRSLVASVLWPGFNGHSAPDWLKRALEEGLAGVVYFSQNIDAGDPAQLARLSAELRSIRSGVLIGVDEEGGNVTRLEALRGSTVPGHWQLGRRDDVELTRQVGAELARRVLAAGANVALAPVADVNTNPRNPVIGVRSFGASAALVSRHVSAMITGLQSGGVAACVKHFPGHGDTHTDSHHALPRLELGWDEIEREHLPPFHAAIAAGARSIMTAHIVVPELGEEPATLNPRVLSRLRAAGFTGTIVTDALDMAAIRATVGAGPGAVQAILAGADLLCIGNPANLGPKAGATSDLDDYLEVQGALLDALDDGSLPVATLERAAASVAGLAVPSPAHPGDTVRRDFSELARGLIQIHGAVPPLPPGATELTVLDLRERATIAVASTTDAFSTALGSEFVVERLVPGPLPRTDRLLSGVVDDALATIPASRTVVVLVDSIAASGPQRTALDAVAAVRPDAIVVNAGLAAAHPLPPLALVETLTASRLAAEALLRLLRPAADSSAPDSPAADSFAPGPFAPDPFALTIPPHAGGLPAARAGNRSATRAGAERADATGTDAEATERR
ncbi:glycoside hydrolase family 3 protein [Glaciibacter sp. 2TAF33]|uniref:glycoside hydrolase family 3 protein n=1 Tax=Glaciibacter sp. 2TAF33 TaxID=3233015 RepID=UPI003F9091B4